MMTPQRSPLHEAVLTWLSSFPDSSVGASQAIELIEGFELEVAALRGQIAQPDASLAALLGTYRYDQWIPKFGIGAPGEPERGEIIPADEAARMLAE